ncbi:MAG: TRAP transporter large permease [Proteobacteria bacterium]|nr:TRAP transporter large permease [Pseudomonadota bacterium]MBU1744842.1 TRAP transporter large permease [Pseudomonadota bacterium]MBU1965057.1 TRAP transporter large permease [Pseudomonadota bacterium]
MGWILFGSFFLFLLIGVPVGLAVGLAALIVFILNGIPLQMVPQTFFEGSSSYALVAVPFFILAGDILARGGISERILAIAEATIGRIRGGLAVVATMASMFIAAISGSGAATTAAVGASLLPEMNKKKYDTDFSAALIASSGSIGVVIPPSVPMVLYAVIAGEGVAKLFMGGFIPGTIMGAGLITYAVWYSSKHGYPASEKLPAREVGRRFVASLWGLMTPVIILGGIFSGYFTPSEAAAIAVDYTLIVACLIYRSLNFKKFYELVVGAGVTSALIMFIIGTAKIFGWGLAFYQIPEAVAKSMISIAGNDYFWIYLMIIIIVLIAGCFMETASALIILTPIFLPLIEAIGGNLIHFGVIMVIGLAIGMTTPPMSINIFVASAISGRSMEQISKAIWPMVIILVAVLFICTYFPWFVLVLPRVFMGVQ